MGMFAPTKEEIKEATDAFDARHRPIHPDNLLVITIELPESVIFSVTDEAIQEYATKKVLQALESRYPQRRIDAWKRYVTAKATITPAMELIPEKDEEDADESGSE